MYRALVERDTSFDGAFFAAIKTTGIFCRPGCGAKKPRRENVEYFSTPAEAERRGYRACLRCRPLEPRLFDDAGGAGGATAARLTRERLGVTERSSDRRRRLGRALEDIRAGASVTQAALASGFESESGFRDAFARLFGAPPTRAVALGATLLRVHWLPTSLGPMLAAATDEAVCLLEFADRRALPTQVATLLRRIPAAVVPGTNAVLQRLGAELEEYFAGERERFTVPVLAPGTPFQTSVWDLLRTIPAGTTRSYADLARTLGRPAAVRAVARANGDNRIAILIPCHRVVGSDGSPTGYAGGIWRKEWLLAHEGARDRGAVASDPARRP
jgi:AraC family transcriptional regulator of adaptative response/methylated-DNA-[protein]-cysteine methyltransferase